MSFTDPEFEFNKRREEFLSAALAFVSNYLTAEQLAEFPGLAEWRARYDATHTTTDRQAAERAYDGSPYDAPAYMAAYLEAFPSDDEIADRPQSMRPF